MNGGQHVILMYNGWVGLITRCNQILILEYIVETMTGYINGNIIYS